MGDERETAPQHLTHHLHSTPEAAREMNAVPWLGAMAIMLAVLVLATGLFLWLA